MEKLPFFTSAKAGTAGDAASSWARNNAANGRRRIIDLPHERWAGLGRAVASEGTKKRTGTASIFLWTRPGPRRSVLVVVEDPPAPRPTRGAGLFFGE